MKKDVCAEEGDLDVVILATKLSSVGYRVHLRSALGGGPGVDCFHNLRNEFLVVAGEGDEDGTFFIIEARFRDHFAIPHPTDRYAGLLELVPAEVALPPAALSPLVDMLCSEMSLAFEERGLSLPPWRQSKSLLSKWLPSKARDVDVSSPGASPPCGASPVGHGPLEMSDLSSGIVTPSGEDSPRAVLRGAVELLIARPQSCLSMRPALKPRSLLSANLAANGGKKEGARTQPASPHADIDPARVRGWTTPPIRRVRMAGGVVS